MLKARGLNSVGNKQELIDRLHLSLAESSVDLDSKLEDELLNVSNFKFLMIFENLSNC
jgi:hypothetical protein